MAKEFGGEFNLRFDDTNPSKEEDEYVQAIIEDVKWLGCDFGDRLYFASDYFEKMYEWAVMLISAGKAYVCDLSADQIREFRGTLTESGRNNPDREPVGRGKPRPLSPACARGNFPTARARCARKSTWRRRISTFATRSCIAS
jgi:glutamyl/glutaminyl-tRNA synthetase